ncbi:MAG: hypothetical protein QGH66_00820 [Dehalococcoidia bacterium]|jgi:hypothetical protein|nr:hypothetical protein [Dehalococcoidia bacterium]
MARSYLCSRHQSKVGKASPQKLVQAIEGCCAEEAGFLSPRMSVMETIFRLLLAGGNQAVSSEEIAQQLSQLRGENVYSNTVEQVLDQEPRFYGIRSLVEEEEGVEVKELAESETETEAETTELGVGTVAEEEIG